jgi:hypothetical protein
MKSKKSNTPTPVPVRPRLDTADSLRHIAMMQNPDRWPVWPYLPLKRYPASGPMQTGYLVHATDARFTVFLGLIAFARPMDDARETFDSFEAIVAAGWEVD